MRLPSVGPAPLAPPSLVATAIGIGRMAGEPASVLSAERRTRRLAWLFGRTKRSPLADPRLEVIRAISAWLARGNGAIRSDLVAAAAHAGWSRNDLRSIFPTVLPCAAS